jgi:hypothetical protein
MSNRIVVAIIGMVAMWYIKKTHSLDMSDQTEKRREGKSGRSKGSGNHARN